MDNEIIRRIQIARFRDVCTEEDLWCQPDGQMEDGDIRAPLETAMSLRKFERGGSSIILNTLI